MINSILGLPTQSLFGFRDVAFSASCFAVSNMRAKTIIVLLVRVVLRNIYETPFYKRLILWYL
jgi:hypothetical protein